jgi:phosphoribosylaminoimidazole-succinocarboxamide synthase
MAALSSPPLFRSRLNLPDRREGKVRDIYTIPGSGTQAARVLLVASDRISAFDVVMPTPITGKGELLTSLSVFWLRFIESKGLSTTHLLSADAAEIPDAAFTPGPAGAGVTPRDALRGRVMLCRRCSVVPIECVARGYLEGSGWKEYQATGSVCGVKLPANLRQCDRLPEPIFTPATKEEQGKHDENISFEKACALVGTELMTTLRAKTLAIYQAASEHAAARGMLIADTKFEFGLPLDGPDTATPILIDEALTPDSSRFWPADSYQPGRPQKSFDKQFLREYLEELVRDGKWNKQAPGPVLPERIVEATRAKYAEARDRLVG